jgi:hypothetical protein
MELEQQGTSVGAVCWRIIWKATSALASGFPSGSPDSPAGAFSACGQARREIRTGHRNAPGGGLIAGHRSMRFAQVAAISLRRGD